MMQRPHMDEHNDINYKTLRRIQQDEQSSASLTKIPTNFYKELVSYLKTLDHSIEQEKNPLKLKLFSDEVQNTKKIANSIYELREKKIVQAALATARGATPDLGNMLEIEKNLYRSLVEQITNSRKEIFENPTGQRKTSPPATPEPAPVIDQSNTHPIVRVLEDTPEFIGTNGQPYLLRKEDVISIPQEMMDPLLKKKVVTHVK
jgi:DNA replication initiation complex subunit (GINS family)